MNQQAGVTNSNISIGFETFGNYVLLKKLAMGGMAEVFLARPASHKGNGRVQVIKRILPHVANDHVFQQMFQTEIQVCMGFNHPHTVQLHDFGDVNRQPYIAMEYIEGKNLKDLILKFIQKDELIPIPMVLSLLAQAASGLSYAHTFVNKVTGEEVHAVHRDISPHNLILSYDGNLKVIDFGIAKATSSMQEATRAGTIKGKYFYLSPEQVNREPVDARADIFALGIVAWELLTLRLPFYRKGDSELTILGTISNCDRHIKAPSFYNCDIPTEVDELVLKALRKDPNERFASASEFQVALRQLMQKHYPEYSYSETAKKMQALFAEEILKEREELRELNMQAQMSLSQAHADSDVTIALAPEPTPAFASASAPGMKDDVDIRLRKIEFLMKQKATTRHYIMFAIYLISLIVLKLDADYDLFQFLIPETKIAEAPSTLVNPTSVKRAITKTTKQRTPARAMKPRRQQQQVRKTSRPKATATQKPSPRPARVTLATQDVAE